MRAEGNPPRAVEHQSLRMAAQTPILATQQLTMEFRGFRALDGINLRIDEGTIHAVIGPNGAGKTTLFNLLSGLLSPSGGRILFGRTDITGQPPHRIADVSPLWTDRVLLNCTPRVQAPRRQHRRGPGARLVTSRSEKGPRCHDTGSTTSRARFRRLTTLAIQARGPNRR